MAIVQAPGSASPKSLVDYARANALPPQLFTEKMFKRELSISGGRWNTLYPYQILVVEKNADGSYAQKRAASGTNWCFTLPIPPESLTFDMPFAIQTHVTMGGIVEEHGGAPVRQISLSGTTGVLFGKGESAAAPTFDFLDTVFAGTIAAAQSTKKAFGELKTGVSFQTNAFAQSEFTDPEAMGSLTGFYQFRVLQYFFEAYAELKRTKEGRNSCLAFAMWKDESVYLVTPQDFQVRRSTQSPMEYMYSLQFKAWKRIKLSAGVAEILQGYVPVQRDPNKLAKMLGKVEQARRVLQDSRKTIQAIGGDVDRSLFTPMREVCLFAKDALSVPISVADLADTIIQSARTAIVALKSTGSAVANFPSNVNDRFAQSRTTNSAEIETALSSLAAEQDDDPAASNSPAFAMSRSAHPANSPFLNPAENFDFFSSVQVGDLHLSPALASAIAEERDRVRNLTRLDFEQRRDAIAQTAAVFANAIGMGNATYNATYGLEAPATLSIDVATDEDMDVLYSLNQLVMEMNRLVVTNDNEPGSKLSSIAAVAGLATKSGIAFRMPRSKFAVPFPYGSTLEMLSFRYLGDPNRWHEIAALNGLQTPFVDEEGFILPFLTNGADNRFTVADAKNLFVGQPVWLSSRSVIRSQRRITKIDHLSPTLHLITVDGPANLDGLTTLANAQVQAFLPNTVNSQQVIYIPSDQEPKEQDFKTKAIAGVDEYDQLLSVGGVDLLLTPSNDLIVTPDGDTRWSVGLTNIIQQVRLALGVRQGTLLHHPEFGLPIEVGMSLADLSASDVVKAAQTMFAGNPTFTGVVAAKVDAQGPVARLGLAISVAGTSQLIPVSVEVAR